MEQELDDIAAGEMDWLTYLRQFYLGDRGLESQVRTKDAGIDPRVVSAVELDELAAEVRIGQFGPYVAREANGERLTAGIPADLPPADLTAELVAQLLAQKSDGPRTLGNDPMTEKPVLMRVGPYGPYVQLGEDEGSKSKPKRASLLKGMKPEELSLDMALRLLSLPRTLGAHPESGMPVQAGVGRFGPYIVHEGRYVSLKAPDDVLEIELERALELLSAAPARRGAGTRTNAGVLHDLGEHPEGGGPIQILSGRYGPYVKHGKINATIPKEMKPESVTVEQAVGWLAAKAANGASKPARGRKSSTSSAKSAGATKSVAKKTTAKKTTPKAATKKSATKKSTTTRAAKKS
jgi:DNA topoisomerase-1